MLLEQLQALASGGDRDHAHVRATGGRNGSLKQWSEMLRKLFDSLNGVRERRSEGRSSPR
jgi:hypothetical protein